MFSKTYCRMPGRTTLSASLVSPSHARKTSQTVPEPMRSTTFKRGFAAATLASGVEKRPPYATSVVSFASSTRRRAGKSGSTAQLWPILQKTGPMDCSAQRDACPSANGAKMQNFSEATDSLARPRRTMKQRERGLWRASKLSPHRANTGLSGSRA